MNTESSEVFQSQEFRAFCHRFGIVLDLDITDLTIQLRLEDVMRVSVEYLPNTNPTKHANYKRVPVTGVDCAEGCDRQNPPVTYEDGQSWRDKESML